MALTSRLPRGADLAALALVAAGCMLRLVWLDADPDYGRWQGFVTDEGRWIENARSLYLFNSPGLERLNLHLLIAPLYQALSFVVFSLVDIGRASARLLPAFAGSALVLFVWLGLRRRVPPVPLLACLLLLVTQEDMVMLSRVSVPEMPAMLLEWLAFVALVRADGRARHLLLAGVLVTAGVAMKATTAPVVIAFVLAAWLIGAGTRGERARQAAVFVAIPLATAAGVILLAAASGLLFNAGSSNDIAVIAGFVRVNEAYRLAAFALQAPLAPTFYVWMLPVWFAGFVCCVQPAALDGTTRRWYIAAAVWLASYMPLVALLEYYPARYQVHALLPLAALLALSLQILLSPAAADVADRFRSLTGRRRMVSAALLALPPAVLLAAFALGGAGRVVPGLDRLGVHIVSIAMCWLALTVLCYRRQPNVGSVALGSAAAVLAWYVGYRLAGWQYWSPPFAGGWAAQWAIMIASAVAVIASRGRLGHRPVIVAAAGGAVALAAVLPYVGSIVAPKFTLRDASRDIGQYLAGHPDIVSDGTEGLFVDNHLPYASAYRLSQGLRPGATLVRLEHLGRAGIALPPGYLEVRRYVLAMTSRYAGGPLYVVIMQVGTSDD